MHRIGYRNGRREREDFRTGRKIDFLGSCRSPFKVAYHDISAKAYEGQQRERELVALQRKAAKLGFALTPRKPAPAEVAA
ncbi:MAG: hypothetical protein ACUVSS_14675 [Anaerolineae bacterium]